MCFCVWAGACPWPWLFHRKTLVPASLVPCRPSPATPVHGAILCLDRYGKSDKTEVAVVFCYLFNLRGGCLRLRSRVIVCAAGWLFALRGPLKPCLPSHPSLALVILPPYSTQSPAMRSAPSSLATAVNTLMSTVPGLKRGTRKCFGRRSLQSLYLR